MAFNNPYSDQFPTSSGGGGGSPTGPAGGDLAGTYPDPTIALNAVTFDKMQEIAAQTIMANPTGSPANPQEVSLDASLEFNGSDELALTDTGVSAGSYTNADITVDAQGRVTAAANGSGGGGLTYSVITGAAVTAAVNNGYILTNNSSIIATLPASFAPGDIIDFILGGTGVLTIEYFTGANIQFLNLTSTTTTGNITTIDLQCRITLIGIVADTTWQVINCVGNVSVN